MSYKKTTRRQVKKSTPPAPSKVPTTARVFVEDFTAAQMKEAVLPLNQLNCPLDELIATAEATYEFLHTADMDRHIRNAFCQLEKQFDFYKNLVQMAVPDGLRVARTG